MIESMDDAVGTLLDTLDRLGIADNTIIIFASDNGGNMYNEVDGTTATSNAPLRGGKATMYEGGVRGPAIVAYPGHVQAGSRSDEVIQSCDFYPTLLELLDVEAATGTILRRHQHRAGSCKENRSIARPSSRTSRTPPTSPIGCRHRSVSTRRLEADPHLLMAAKTDSTARSCSILREDLGEQKDLAGDSPERVQKLDQLIEAFLADTNAVVPLPNPNFDPAKYRPELEGKAELKGSGAAPKKKTSRPGKPLAGWQPGGTCTLSLDGDSLVVTSDGGDPHLSYTLPKRSSTRHSC